MEEDVQYPTRDDFSVSIQITCPPQQFMKREIGYHTTRVGTDLAETIEDALRTLTTISVPDLEQISLPVELAACREKLAKKEEEIEELRDVFDALYEQFRGGLILMEPRRRIPREKKE
jgi:hypothetical protein